MINDASECRRCYSKTICSLAALAFETKSNRVEIPELKAMETQLPKVLLDYFKQQNECINLEWCAEK